jgi:hypothetical protein
LAEYIFPVFIFITTLFLCGLLFGVSKICLVLSGAATYAVWWVAASYPEYSTAILSIIFFLELIILIALVIVDREHINVKAFSIWYTIFIGIAYVTADGCYNKNENDKLYFAKRANEIATYRSQYDFNIDSLALKINPDTNSVKRKIKLKPPFIIYKKLYNEMDFDYNFNKSLEKSFTSFSIDSINTIIVLEESSVYVGNYNNGKTSAYKSQITIYFIDPHTMNTVTSTTLTGGDPPSSITYRRIIPDSKSGSEPTREEILETIMEELN